MIGDSWPVVGICESLCPLKLAVPSRSVRDIRSLLVGKSGDDVSCYMRHCW